MNKIQHQPPSTATARGEAGITSDEVLTERVRQGDVEAFAALYLRHVDAVKRVARRYGRDESSREDLVSAAVESTIRALVGGAGPRSAVRAYMCTCVRHQALKDRQHDRRHVTHADAETFDNLANKIEVCRERLDLDEVARAYEVLPERWRAALWYTVVEELAPAEAAGYMGITTNALNQLAFRARAGLRASLAGRERTMRRTVFAEKTAVARVQQKPAQMKLSKAPRSDYIAMDSRHGLAAPQMVLSKVASGRNVVRVAGILG